MNYFFYKNIVFFLLFWGINVACQALQAQNPKDLTYGTIDSLRILPDEPTVDDEISVVAYTSFGYSDCTLDSIVRIGIISGIDTSLVVRVQHSVSNTITAECQSIDTVNIGKLELGAYSLLYRITSSLLFDLDVKSTAFVVSSKTSINSELESIGTVHIYPNPSQNFISVEFESTYSSDIQEIKLFDISGRNVLNKKFDRVQSKVLVDISSLETGLYNLIVLSGNRKHLRKIVKL